MAQRGIDLAQQIGVVVRVFAPDPRILGIGRQVAVDQREYPAARHNVRLLDEAPQPLPVLRLVGRRDHLIGQIVLAQHIIFQRRGTSLSQTHVIVIGSLGRGVTLDADRRNARIGIVAHEIYRGHDLAQLLGVAAVVLVYLGAVDREIDICRALHGARLYPLGNRAYIYERRLEAHRLPLRCKVEPRQLLAVALRLLVAAAAHDAVDADPSRGHPLAVGYYGAILDTLHPPVAVNGLAGRLAVVAQMMIIAVATGYHDRLHAQRIAPGRNVGRKAEIVVALQLQRSYVDIHRHENPLPVARYGHLAHAHCVAQRRLRIGARRGGEQEDTAK